MRLTVDRVLLLGHFGGKNFGDELMLKSFVDSVPAGAVYLVVSRRPSDTARLLDHRHKVIGMSVWEVLSALWQSNAVVVVGGTHFHDDYPSKRLLRHYRYLCRFTILFCLARALRRSVLMLSTGLGPCQHMLTRGLARAAIGCCHSVVARDTVSFNAARELKRSAKVVRGYDIAFLAAHDIAKEVRIIPGRLGVSLTSVERAARGYGLQDKELVAAVSKAILSGVARRSIGEVEILEIRGGEREGDQEISRALEEALQTHGVGVSYVEHSDDPYRMVSIIAACESFIGMRYHANLVAAASCRRVMMVAYHQKVIDLASMVGLGPECVADVGSVSSGQLLAALENFLVGELDGETRTPREELLRLASENVDEAKKWIG